MELATRRMISKERQQVHSDQSTKNTVMYLSYKYFIVNMDGNRISKKYENISDFQQDVAIFVKGEKKGAVDVNGKEILGKLYDNVSLDQDVIRICENGKWGFADLDGKIICEPKYEFIERFNNGYARIAFKDKTMQEFHWGVIAKNGEIIICPNYYYLGSLDRPSIVAKDIAGFGLIDINEKIIVPFRYKSLRSEGESEFLYNSNEDKYCV